MKADLDPNKLRQADAWYWAYYSQIQLHGQAFKLQGHEYQVAVLQEEAQRQCAKKGAQMCFTETCVVRTLHGMIYNRYPQGALYLFPTQDDVTDFSKGRFAPLIADNPETVGRHVADTDAANIKRVGKAMLYLRGARATKKIEGTKRTSSKLKSVPVDLIVYDEMDEMAPDMIELARERVSHSELQHEFFLSTPSIPDFGIDRLYSASDQRVWMIRCKACGTDTCLELEFPECLLETATGKVIRACKKCKQEIFPRDGRWVAQYPDRAKDMVGWWISQLNSMYVDPGTILGLYKDPPNGDLSEVYNSKLGMAYIAAENRLTVNDVYRCCSQDAMLTSHPGPCAMGVDVGKQLHVVIGFRPNDRMCKIAWVGRVSEFSDLHDLAQRFHVADTVIDALPETRKCREFQAAEQHAVHLCEYKEHQKVGPTWTTDGICAVNRTEICDTTHTLVVEPGMLAIPRRNPEIEEYALEMSNIAKVLEEDPETGLKVYRYRKLGADHYRHATNYFALAATRIGTYHARTGERNRPSRRRDGRVV